MKYEKFSSLFNILICSLLSIEALAAGSYIKDDYDSNFFQEEGNVLVKIGGAGILTKAQQVNLPNIKTSFPSRVAKEVGAFAGASFGTDTSATVFFQEKFASQLSLGFNIYRTELSSIQSVEYNYRANTNDTDKLKLQEVRYTYAIPSSFILQYYPAPFGGIMPYMGAGYSYTYFFSRAEEYDISGAFGPVLQIGCDFVQKDNTLIFIEAKYLMVEPKIRYKENLVATSISSTIKLNPIVISLGMGLKF